MCEPDETGLHEIVCKIVELSTHMRDCRFGLFIFLHLYINR